MRSGDRDETARARCARVYDEIAIGERPPDSKPEPAVTRLLRRLKPRPQWQHDCYDANGVWLGRPDWYVEPALATIEHVGRGPHTRPDVFERDFRRRERFKAAGYEVIEHTALRFKNEPVAVLGEIQRAIDRRLELATTGYLDRFRPPSGSFLNRSAG